MMYAINKILNARAAAKSTIAMMLAMFLSIVIIPSSDAQILNGSNNTSSSTAAPPSDNKTAFQQDAEQRKNEAIEKSARDAGREAGAAMKEGFDSFIGGSQDLSDFSKKMMIESTEWGILGAPLAVIGGTGYLLGEGGKILAKGGKIFTAFSADVEGKLNKIEAGITRDVASGMRKFEQFVGDNAFGSVIGWLADKAEDRAEKLEDSAEFLKGVAMGVALGEKKTNAACKIEEVQKKYMGSCYSCLVVKTLIETFMNACSKVYDLCKDAGVIILMIGTALGLAVQAIKSVSSFTSVEPADQINQLIIFLFKVLAAYVIIQVGILPIMHLAVNPILAAGADFGIAIMNAGGMSIELIPKREFADAVITYEYTGAEVVSPVVINKIMALNAGLDQYTSLNLLIGHALTCHAVNAGVLPVGDYGIYFEFPDIWIWLCGAIIWFFGFMLTLGISFYLLDVCFKIGFAIIVLPIAVALWPFNLTKDKLTSVFSIIFKSAGVFAFLAVTTTFAMVLISESFRDVDTLVEKIQTNDAKWVSDTFAIFGPHFIIIVFCYLYAMKLIASTVGDYADKFFGDNVFGGSSPIHKRATGAVSGAKNAVGAVGSFGKDVVKHQGEKLAGKAWKGVKNKFKKDKGGGGGSTATSAAKTAGKTAKQSGKMAQKTGKMMDKAGQGMSKAGAKLSATKFGAIVGVPLMALGKVTSAGGKAMQAGGKITEKAGEATEKAAKAAEKAQEGKKGKEENNKKDEGKK